MGPTEEEMDGTYRAVTRPSGLRLALLVSRRRKFNEFCPLPF